MGKVIAVAGKGGTGKTTIAALMVMLLADEGQGSILAVDADPNNNLGAYLGVPVRQTIGSLLDEVAANPEVVPVSMSKDRFIEYRVHTAIEEAEGFDLLTMGRPEGPGCYCYVNNVLRNCMDKLIREYAYVVIDNEAGLEHLSRRTTRSADILLIISDATAVGLKAAGRIAALSDELKITINKKFLLINRTDNPPSTHPLPTHGVTVAGIMPMDEEVMRISLDGESLRALHRDAPIMQALFKAGAALWH